MNKFRSIRATIAFAFSCLIIVSTLVTSVISYRLSQQAVESNVRVSVSELIKQVNSNIQSYITNMENISLLVLNNPEVRHYISSASFIGEDDRRPYEKKIYDLFQSIMITRKDIASIMVFGYNGRFVTDRRVTNLNPYADITKQAWYADAKQSGGPPVISTTHVQNILQNQYRWVVSLSREIKGADGMTGEGIFLVDLNFSVIQEICEQVNLGQRGYVFIVDKEGGIVYHPHQQLIYSHLKKEAIEPVLEMSDGSFEIREKGRKRIYSVQDTSYGWKIVGVSYTDELITNEEEMRLSFFLWGLIALSVVLICSMAISHRLAKPIIGLTRDMKQVEQGNFNVVTEMASTNEIAQLARAFNMMVGEIKKLMKQIVAEQEFKRKSELKALQAQINPHFIYNTLDSIVWMAEAKKNEEVVWMTSSLAKMLRIGIHRDDEVIPIWMEVEHIRSYLRIQQMRYEDQLNFRIEMNPEITMFKTLKVILQPFVENAIYHGIKNRYGMGTVRITGEPQGNHIVFEVMDDGIGMTPEQLSAALRGSGTKERKRIGIANVHERIQLYFGQDYGVTFESRPGEGTKVTILIPKLE
ncbi:sensor histidine kinase [Paenibacillus sp. J2TS4]|uniref:cache domain-containing sensor histidine kinase n=1 Tax=Paenibacillus sp. J2TS4 TaxID=2807194 RepID=UPI001B1CD71D|nr:sensor histidine kinase [Paenibacillus sp. J2TS4]GIP32512.1 histidine kinase [Paenibacillus sp. J2TS4]